MLLLIEKFKKKGLKVNYLSVHKCGYVVIVFQNENRVYKMQSLMFCFGIHPLKALAHAIMQLSTHLPAFVDCRLYAKK